MSDLLSVTCDKRKTTAIEPSCVCDNYISIYNKQRVINQ